ncbi:MAG TPA: SRPBCC family protein [Candidatus Methylomirabilis sp.]|nr:SRPBCC family protein [Candidatus Methylomirabilis sp.]
MTDSKNFGVIASGERDIIITRDFNAPRRLVFEAYTKPELLKRWLLGPPGWEMISCEVANRVGDKYRYVWRHADGQQFGMGGVCREFVPPERMVCTENMDGYPSEALITTVLVERGGITKLTTTATYVSRKVRDMALKSGMERGVAASYDRLDEILASSQSQASSQSAG